MAYRLSKQSLEISIRHLVRYGDTDVFPHLHELAFYKDKIEDVVDELSKLDLDSYNPESAMEALAPKSRLGFRITHQSGALDTLLLLASVVEIGEEIENHRMPIETKEAFSYRFAPNQNGQLFRGEHTYKDWLHHQQDKVKSSLKIRKIVKTDISDFYARINYHRLENLLDEVKSGHGAVRYIKKAIKVIRARQSFGLPVGGTAARLLAELALVDIDRSLSDNGIVATRFVDDFRIFLNEGDDAYDALSFLANQLSVNEGLALNATKTAIQSRSDFLKSLRSQISDIVEEAEGEALDSLTADIYFDDEPSFEDLETLKAMNLLGFLQEELSAEDYDIGKIKVIFRALKIAIPEEVIPYIEENFSELSVFSKELVLLMQALDSEYTGCFSSLTEDVIASILEPPASSVQLIRTWLLELFARGIVPINIKELKNLEALPTVLDKRQLHIIRSLTENKSYFRMNKASCRQLSRFELPAFVAGASCLPKDEFKNWLITLKPNFSGPTDQLFLQWVQSVREEILDKIGTVRDRDPD